MISVGTRAVMPPAHLFACFAEHKEMSAECAFVVCAAVAQWF